MSKETKIETSKKIDKASTDNSRHAVIAKRKADDSSESNKKAKSEKPESKDQTLLSDSNSSVQDKKQEIIIEKDCTETKELSVNINSPTAKDPPSKILQEFLSPPSWSSKTHTSTIVTPTTMSTFTSDNFSTSFSISTPSHVNQRTTLGSSIIPNPSQLSGIPSPSSLTTAKAANPVSIAPSTTVFNISTPILASKSTVASSPSQQSLPKNEAKVVRQNQNIKPSIPVQMGPPKVDSSPKMTACLPAQPSNYPTSGRSRIGPIMQVRCKAMSAYLYTSKYESGSKGKCILMDDEWLTPNEFEEKSGSKAKKYLSSIKCLGRPLRAYVNSGELRGLGTPQTTPKMQRLTPKPPAPIAPAPPPVSHGSNASQINMSQLGMPTTGMSASPHMGQSFTPVAMAMGNVTVAGGPQPILINQSNFSVANSLTATGMQQGQLGGTSILTPMTFTLAPMAGIDGRQNIGVQQPIHNSQHIRQDYVLPE